MPLSHLFCTPQAILLFLLVVVAADVVSSFGKNALAICTWGALESELVLSVGARKAYIKRLGLVGGAMSLA